MSKLSRLGRGVESLIPKSYVSASRSIMSIPLDDIHPNAYQPRIEFDEEALTVLAHSIKENGVVQPIVVRKSDSGYELVAGERRYRACLKLGLKEVPAIVKDLSDKESLKWAMVENIDREDLNPLEEAKGYLRLINEFDMTQQEVAEIFGRSRSSVANRLRLLKLPIEVQEAISSGQISEGHARALISVGDTNDIVSLHNEIIENGLNVREVEDLASQKKKVSEKSEQLAFSFKEVSERLTRDLGTKVMIKAGKSGGKVTLPFKSQEELGMILALFERYSK